MTDSMEENGEDCSLGSWLRSARETRGESLDDVARVTRIGKGYLEAIELGEMHKLPSEAYARGFVRLYATHLGLSGDEAVARLQGRSAAAAVPPQSEPAVAAAGEESVSRKAGGRHRPWTIPLTLLFFLLMFATLFPLKNDRSPTVPPAPPAVPSPPVPIPQSPTAPPQDQQLPPGGAPATVEPSSPTGEATQPRGIILRLKAVQAGKLHMTIDGVVSQEYDLNVGDLMEWKAEKMFLLELDNAGSVEGDLNGRPLQPFGEPGRAAHLVISAEGVRQE